MAYDRVIVWECLFVALMVLLFMMGIIVPFSLEVSILSTDLSSFCLELFHCS